MRNSLLLAIGMGLVLSLTVGCKTKPRTTPLPGASTTGSGISRSQADLNTSPFNTLADGGLSSVTPTNPGDLPDDRKLEGRDLDRTRFANQTVYFEFDRSNVPPDEASKIEQVAGEFKAMTPDYDLLIEGHCDERGTEEYNRALGERRALALREMLIQSGVDSRRVFTKTFGEDRPALLGHDEAAWSKNRRGEFILVLPKKFTTTQSQ
jgi:peptidoglycan-associated lipoprotein